MKAVSLTVTEVGSDGIRLDTYVTDHGDGLTRSQLKARARQICVNGAEAKLSKRVFTGDRIEIEYAEQVSADLESVAMDLDIIFENRDVIVVNKPQGLVVHPAAGNPTGTLVNGLIHHCESLRREFSGELDDERPRPGIVHRLDKDTSGVIIVAKHPYARDFLASQFRRRKTRKTYLAITRGIPIPPVGEIRGWIDRDRRDRKKFTVTEGHGKRAVTGYRMIRRKDGHALVELHPVTGRTHQLRVHMRSIQTPILGDPTYSNHDPAYPDAALMLHAYRLSIRIPGEETARTFRAPIPDRMKHILRSWRKKE
jgi:23S rRNA pseudouridine1911/1915/1917 synthase